VQSKTLHTKSNKIEQVRARLNSILEVNPQASPSPQLLISGVSEVAKMTLNRWEPYREIESLRRRFDRLLDGALRTPLAIDPELHHAPAAELEETADALLLRLELPGIDPKTVDVEVTADSVSIAGERRSEKTVPEGSTFRTEFRYGKFQRVISLPTRVQNAQATANYQNGILELRLPKVEEEKNKVVKLSIG
jgi:HSP20 family protein